MLVEPSVSMVNVPRPKRPYLPFAGRHAHPQRQHRHAESPRDAHLLAMCAKLAYEDPRIIADVLQR